MVAFKGRCSMKQSMPNKIQDSGFKAWMLVGCETNFVVKFEVYTGKTEDGPEHGHATWYCV